MKDPDEAQLERRPDVPLDGIDRCRWYPCYRPSNGAGRLFCSHHENAQGAELLRQALILAHDLELR